MNNIKSTILLLVLLFVGAQSCQKDVSLEPISFEPTTFTTEALLFNQLIGVYNALQSDQMYGQGLWGYLTAGADESFRLPTGTNPTFVQYYNINSTDNNVLQFWRSCYMGIERANVLLDVADKPAMNDTKRNSIKGQAKFLRAYFYYLLVTNFGDVPLKTQLTTDMGIDFNVPRAPAKDVYNYIIKEMTEAEEMVQEITAVNDWQTSRPTTTVVSKSAVQAILARVCLSMAGEPINDNSKYAEALKWGQKLISSNRHTLVSAPLSLYPTTPAYATTFINNMQNNVNDNNITEGIWDVAFLSKSNATGTYAATGNLVTQTLGAMMGVFNPDQGATSINGYSQGNYRVYPKLYNLYKKGDLRRDWAIAPYLYKNTTSTRYFSLTVNIAGGGGTGATATAFTDAKGGITRIEIDNGGTGYTSAPTVTFSAFATNATASESVTGTNIAAATATVANGQVTAITVTKAGAGYPTVYDRCAGKWRREYETNLPPTRLRDNTSCNFPVVRYADVLLMAAEADLKVNGSPSANAIGYYNQVRRRAYGLPPATIAPQVDVTTFTLQDIMDERARELCFEGQRRQDLIRWGIMQKTMQDLQTEVNATAPTAYLTTAATAAQNFLARYPATLFLPIPANELALNNKLTQNSGW